MGAGSLMGLLGCGDFTRQAQGSDAQAGPDLPVAALPAALPPPPAPSGVVELVAVGDLIPHPPVKDTASRADLRDEAGTSLNHEGWDAVLAPIADEIRAADLAFLNLETPIAPDHHKTIATKIFDARPALLDAIVAAGFDVVSFANNHVYDQGRDGFVETLGRLAATPLVSLGAGNTCAEAAAPHIVAVNGLKLAFIGSTRIHNAPLNRGPDLPCSFLLDQKVVAREAAEVRAAGADLVILSVHWGVEYETKPKGWDVTLAHQLLDGGVDLILGHHPHVLQPVEAYTTKDGRHAVVAYSLGNFVSAQAYLYTHGVHALDAGNARDGALLRVRIARQPDGHVSLDRVAVDPLWTEWGTDRCLREEGKRYTIHPVLDREALVDAKGAVAAETDPERVKALQGCEKLYADRREHAGKVVGASWLVPDDATGPASAEALSP